MKLSITISLILITLITICNNTYSQCDCNALPAPGTSETVVTVSTMTELQSALSAASGPTTIYLNNGTYTVNTSTFVNVSKNNITIRSTSGNRDDVIIQGGGMAGIGTVHGFYIDADNVTIADVTVKNVQKHGFFVNPGSDDCLFHNVRGVDCGEQIFKASGGATSAAKNNGIIECSLFEYTTTLDDGDDGWYTNGIDLLYCHNWIIRDNTIRNIKHNPSLTTNLAGPAILIWKESTNTIIERNKIIDCDFGISFGNAGEGGVSHTGGIIRNNFIKGYSSSDFGIGLVYAPNAKVINNTVYSPGGWGYSIEARFSQTSNCIIMNNFCDEAIWDDRNGATCTLTSNSTTASSSDFVDISTGDLHLISGSTSAANAGTISTDRTMDIDCNNITDNQPDVGADEYNSATVNVFSKENDIVLLPNPTNNYFVVNIKDKKIKCIEIIDINGKLIEEKVLDDNSHIFNISAYPKGIYFVKINIDNSIFTKKIVII